MTHVQSGVKYLLSRKLFVHGMVVQGLGYANCPYTPSYQLHAANRGEKAHSILIFFKIENEEGQQAGILISSFVRGKGIPFNLAEQPCPSISPEALGRRHGNPECFRRLLDRHSDEVT